MDYCSLLVSKPEEFLSDFENTLKENAESIDFLWPKHDIALFQPHLNERIIQKIYADSPIERSARNDMMLDVLISSIFRLDFTHLEDEPEITMDVLLTIIHAFFPQN